MSGNSRRGFFKKFSIGILSFPLCDWEQLKQWSRRSFMSFRVSKKVYFTTGFKVMEVQETAALVWTRLCSQEFPNPVIHRRREEVFRHPIGFDEGQPVGKMDGAVAGCSGMVRFRLLGDGVEKRSAWLFASAENDFTVSFHFEDLLPGKQYRVEIEGKAAEGSHSNFVSGTFKTLPGPSQISPVNLVTSTCQYFWSFDDEKRGFKVYDSMRKLTPDLFIHTGDYVYYDKPGPMATTLEKARHKWHAMDARPSIREFYANVPIYMVRDDHDLLKNDVYPGISPFGLLTYDDGLRVWHENVPLSGKPYRTIRFGRDLQIWMVEGREYRSPNGDPDGPEKTIWGKEQKEWFMKTLEMSDATFRLLFTPTPVVGPDRPQKKDNHANAVYQSEGKWLREYLSQHKGLYVVNGDRHWQYVSQDQETGLIEFGSGPVSDYHAQGWDENDKKPEHRFLRVKGGFLNIRVTRNNGSPSIEFIHCDVDGNAVHSENYLA